MGLERVLLAGAWQAEDAADSFHATDPTTGRPLAKRFPVSSRATLERALDAGVDAAEELAHCPPEHIADFLEHCADELETRAEALVEAAHQETGLPRRPRLLEVELPRTTGQLRQAALAARARSFCLPTLDTKNDIRSMFEPLGGPVLVLGPNNFPFAFNAVMGGDFAAALAARNPVIAKAHPSHPETTRLLSEAACAALASSRLPKSSLQLVYQMPPELGLEIVADRRLAATAFTGSRKAGLGLKAAADRAGKPIYLEMSSINPVFVLPGALGERSSAIAGELLLSCTLGAGQFCTNPGLSVLVQGPESEAFVEDLGQRFAAQPGGTLLGAGGIDQLVQSLEILTRAGAQLVVGGHPGAGPGYAFENTLLSVSGDDFLEQSQALQTEAFGAVHLCVLARDPAQMLRVAEALEGNLTGSVYSHTGGEDDAVAAAVSRALRPRVGRLLNDKMPTGVAVSPAMSHGGPFPATGHPGFTSVGIPASIRRFTALRCYDGVRACRLPPELRDDNPTGCWRLVDGAWTRQGFDR